MRLALLPYNIFRQEPLAAVWWLVIHIRDTRYAIRNTRYAIRGRLTLPIRNAQTQYAIRSPPHTAHTQYTNTIRNTQPASHCPYAMRRRNTQYAARLTLPIRNAQTQYAIRSPPHTAHTQCADAIRNTQATSSGPSHPQHTIRKRNAQCADRLKSEILARNPQHTNAIRDTQWPPRAAFSAGNGHNTQYSMCTWTHSALSSTLGHPVHTQYSLSIRSTFIRSG
jgi:hypothetical protein